MSKMDKDQAKIIEDTKEIEIIRKYLLQKAVWSGEEISSWINNGDLHENQIQPNGIDLTIDKVFVQRGNVKLCRDKHSTDKGVLIEVEPLRIAGIKERGWFLESGYYTIQWAEEIQIPPNAIGLLSPRSTLLRTCATIYGAVWDKGYHGIGQSGLHIFDSVLIERGTRMAQMLFIEAAMDQTTYEGQYQGENIAKEKKEKNKTD